MVILFCLTDKGKENYKFRGFLVPPFRDASPRISEVQKQTYKFTQFTLPYVETNAIIQF